MKKVILVDYKLGNLFSVHQALVMCGLNVIVTSDPKIIKTADAVVLPGVGAFKKAMLNLEQLNLIEPIKKIITDGKPFFGICLGYQLLFTESEEFGICKGLNILSGKVKSFKRVQRIYNLKIPHIGWNKIERLNLESIKKSPLREIKNNEYMYFVHSFYVEVKDRTNVLTTTDYNGFQYASSVMKDNIFACQFHPEKSAHEGLKVYKEWAKINQLN